MRRMTSRVDGVRTARGPWTEKEQARDLSARRAAVRRARERGPGRNIEDGVRLIKAGQAMHGVARR